MNDRVIRLKAKIQTTRKNDTYAPPSKEGFLKMKEPSKKEDTPKKIFLNIDGHCLINVDDISYVGIEKVTTSGSGIVYTVKIWSSYGFILWSSNVGDKEEITHLYYRIHEILKTYGIYINYVELEPSEFRL